MYGIAVDETTRIKKERSKHKTLPLVDWQMTEADCLEYCYSKEFFWKENGVRLYDMLDRVSCWCCANKNKKELENMRLYLPDYYLKYIDLLKKIKENNKKRSCSRKSKGTIFKIILESRGRKMREYRFRGKDKNTGKWVYGFYLEQDTYSMGSKNTKKDLLIKDAGVIVQNSKYDSGTVIDKETLGQYTGLKDKNGKEIYEGDILELNKDGRIFYGTPDGLLVKKYQLVGFKDGAFMTCRNKHLIDDYDTYLWIISKYSTVAGNIYDNKNLLEENKSEGYI